MRKLLKEAQKIDNAFEAGVNEIEWAKALLTIAKQLGISFAELQDEIDRLNGETDAWLDWVDEQEARICEPEQQQYIAALIHNSGLS